MHYNGLVLQGSDSLFHLSAVNTTAAKRALPGSSSRVSFSTRQRSSFGSLRAEAAINDGFVSEAAQLSFYELLSIPESGSLLEIKQAYKQLARKYHPDVSPPDRVEEYTKTFILVQEAYETLSDPSLRAMYDRDMARGIHLAFSARKRYPSDEDLQRGEWKNRWQSQLSELKRRSMSKDSGQNMSWAASMRMNRNKSSDES